MLQSGEGLFRQVEKKLDFLLQRARDDLEEEGFAVADESARTYHYKNQYLMWAARVERNWRLSHEKARVTVWAAFFEPAVPKGELEVELTRRSEVFQDGRLSRVLLRAERRISLAELERQGFAAVVKQEVAAGSEELENDS